MQIGDFVDAVKAERDALALSYATSWPRRAFRKPSEKRFFPLWNRLRQMPSTPCSWPSTGVPGSARLSRAIG